MIHLLPEPRAAGQISPANTSGGAGHCIVNVVWLEGQVTVPVVEFKPAVSGTAVKIAIFPPVGGKVVPVPGIPTHGGVNRGTVNIEHPFHPLPVNRILCRSDPHVAIRGGLDHGGNRRIVIPVLGKPDRPVAMKKDRTLVARHCRRTGRIIRQGPAAGHTPGIQPVVHVIRIIHKPRIIDFE